MAQQPENQHGFQQANYDEVIFRAEKANATLTLSDETNPVGSRVGLHYISVMPYFEGEE